MKRLRMTIVIILLFSNIIFSQELIWKHTGGPMGGIVGGMDINSYGEIYAGMYPFLIGYMGLYKSTDNGDSWNKIVTQFEDFQVFSIYVTKEDIIWVGTDNQGKLYRSTDDGKTWENKANGYGAFECWAIGESKDGILFAGDANFGRLYRSTNNGESWQFSSNIAPLAFAADSNNTVYAGTFNGLYKTTDDGVTWIQDSFFVNIQVASVIIDVHNNIYCGTGYYNNGDGVFYSADGGENWMQLGLAGKEVLSLAFDSKGSLFAGTLFDGLFKTTDMGQNWIQYQKGIYRKEIYRLKINQQDDIFIGSEGGGQGWLNYSGGGVFRSTNDGDSFEQVGLPISMVKNVVFSGDSLVITSTPSGVQKYNRFTKKWNNIGLQNVEAVSMTPTNILYAATSDDGLYKSTDIGAHWLLTKLTADTLMPVYNVLAINDDTLFAATGYWLNLRRSLNGGENWDVLSVRTGETYRGLFFKNNQLFVTGFNSGQAILYKSDNLGESFDQVYSGFDTYGYNNPISATSNGYVFLASLNSYFDGIIRSTDDGLTWGQVLFKRITPIVFANDNGIVITSSDSIHLSTNYGETWQNFYQPIGNKVGEYVTDINQDLMNKFFCGTSTNGLYAVDIITQVEEESLVNNNFYLYQNYPNPFNPATTIKYSLPLKGFVKLTVYDILGREVALLVNEEQPAGNYSVEFNAFNLPSGTYFYTLTSGNFTETKKLILLK